ncbi:excinuclease ABC subunit UvrC [Pontibacter sp. G13]|uniref:excinuclease ABC subunit UvrC n=1 Tax=Pontibacter sp. G13 TaxID=3074898 RepID=UPI00288994D3|nr:excinuclease ABC subunit UvrC [Pontibacter sp. G13]WNJ21400.1 excinuclease ABC subunit UvrC [Pontibacter sp. G13]
MPHREDVLEKVKSLPKTPGVYRFFNQSGKIIYIGKAKNLKSRVSSYFANSRPHSYRIRKMVGMIHDLEYTVVHSEAEALLLENNLIKSHQPKYNILLKDGKTYPYICIKNERFPRVFSTRTKIDDGSTYFGPYPSVAAMRAILDLIRSMVKLRTCNYYLSESNIQARKFKRCLEYQIGNCLAPCEGLQSEADYMQGIDQIKHILKGNLGPVIRKLEGDMMSAAENYEFEKAEYLKRRVQKVKDHKRKSTVVSEKISNLEVLTVEVEETLAVVNHFQVQEGAIISTHAWEYKLKHQEEPEEIIGATLEQLFSDEEIHHEIVSNVQIPAEFLPEEAKVHVPQRGDKKHLVDLSLKNCQTLLTEKLYKQNFKVRQTPGERMVEALQVALNMKTPPNHIECFDNSNFQGASPVASMVVFKQGKASKRDYRHFNIKTVEGPNDFASMEEIVHRRYKRLLDEQQPLPDLIVIDGGKGQLTSAAMAMEELDLLGKIPVIGIAKRLEEIYRVGDPIPLHIDKKNAGLHLIQQIRNEAHRFAITFHRNKRSNAANQRSKLTSIKGIGEAAEQDIIRKFKSIKKLKAASHEERVAKIGAHKAKIIQAAIESGEL